MNRFSLGAETNLAFLVSSVAELCEQGVKKPAHLGLRAQEKVRVKKLPMETQLCTIFEEEEAEPALSRGRGQQQQQQRLRGVAHAARQPQRLLAQPPGLQGGQQQRAEQQPARRAGPRQQRLGPRPGGRRGRHGQLQGAGSRPGHGEQHHR